jgi:glycosyltransferase involved in cell wall biosynthesis
VVTTDTPGCREVVRNGENGFLVPVRDANALAGAIKALLLNPQLRAEMGRVGRERVVREFADALVIEQTLAVYRAVLGKTQAKHEAVVADASVSCRKSRNYAGV